MLTTPPMAIPASRLASDNDSTPFALRKRRPDRLNCSALEVLHERRTPAIPGDADVHGSMALAQDVVAMTPVRVGVVVHHRLLVVCYRLSKVRNDASHEPRATALSVPLSVRPTTGGCVLTGIARTAGLAVHHVRLPTVGPPVAEVVVREHILGVQLRCGVRAEHDRRQAVVGPITVDEPEGQVPQGVQVLVGNPCARRGRWGRTRRGSGPRRRGRAARGSRS